MKLYSIKGWNAKYENNRTRELKKLDWVPVPNKQDGEGYCLIMEQKDGPAILGAWLAIIQIASKCDNRGTLMRDSGTPHDSASISRQCRFPKALIERALDFLASKDVQWVEVVDVEVDRTEPQEGAGKSHEGITEGKERREGKGREDILPDGFDAWWEIYPKKESKKKVIAAWERIKPPLDKLMATMAWQVKTRKWLEGFAPNPLTYLNGELWNDLPEQPALVFNKDPRIIEKTDEGDW